MEYIKQLFEGEYDGGTYCDFSAAAAKAIAGKDIILGVWNADGTELMAIAGQQGLTINRSADTLSVDSKDSDGWKASIPGMKQWSIDTNGVYVKDDAAHKHLATAFESGDPVCLKVYNKKTQQGMFGGLASLTDYPIEAPYDDSVTYSMSFTGMGKLTDLSE